jgi:hypothetical protein
MRETLNPLPINTLITERRKALGLSRTDLIQRAGYSNIAKGLRRLDAICDGEFQVCRSLLHSLPSVLEVSPVVLARAVEDTKRQFQEAEEAAYRSSFVPHAVILTEREIPHPIFVAAILGVDRLLRLDFDLTKSPATFVDQALRGVGEKLARWAVGVVPAFGEPTGVIVSYSPDRAVQYDLSGNLVAQLDEAYTVGTSSFSLKGRAAHLTQGELAAVFGVP